jgi:two-component system, NarL family, response regulator DegU
MEADTRISISIADPNTLLRDGLQRILPESSEFVIVGEAANDVETMQIVEERKPDVLLLDLNIPKLQAVPLLLAIKEQSLPTRTLVMSLVTDEPKLLNCAKAGARGYILKAAPATILIEAIKEVARGRIWVDREVGCADAFALLAHRANTTDEIGAQINIVDVLSKRELEILSLIGRGLKNEDIGKKLFISVPTVKAHVAHIFSKLKVNNRTQAALLLMQSRLRSEQDFPGPFSRQREMEA